MRLVCPKCAAQYEVGESAIPEAGRDVQCSDCGHGWFQQRRAAVAAKTLIGEASPPFAGPPVQDGPAARAGTAPSEPPRRTLDEQVMSILREEALREIAARRTESGPGEGAPGPGPAPLVASSPPPVPATLVAPRPPAPPGAHRPVPQRGLLPDVEEISSTLKAGTPRHEALVPGSPENARRGFRAGFAVMVGVIAVAASAYVLAPTIAETVPESAEALEAYVGTVDYLRRQLDSTVTTAQKGVESLLLSVE